MQFYTSDISVFGIISFYTAFIMIIIVPVYIVFQIISVPVSVKFFSHSFNITSISASVSRM